MPSETDLAQVGDRPPILSLLERAPSRGLMRWLKSGSPRQAFGLPLLDPRSEGTDGCMAATVALQICRPDLPPDLLVLRTRREAVLCARSPEDGRGESELVEIDLGSAGPARPLGLTFEEYLRRHEDDLARAERILDRIEWLISKHPDEYDHVSGGKLPRAHQWRVVRSCVHDRVVGLAGIRQHDQLNATIVDVFEASDHPLYEAGHGLRSLTAMVLGEAYKSGASLALHFRNVSGLRGPVVPAAVHELASSLEIEIASPGAGVITNAEGVALFAAISGLGPDAFEAASKLPPGERPSREALSFLVISGIWTPEEAEWILRHAPQPTHLLFGALQPDDWLSFESGLAYARAAILAQLFRASLNEGGEEGAEATRLKPVDGGWHIDVHNPAESSWNGSAFSAGDQIALAAWPRQPLAFEGNLVAAEAERLARTSTGEKHRLLLYASDQGRVSDRDQRVLRASGVDVVIAPYSVAELDALAEVRFARARRVRR